MKTIILLLSILFFLSCCKNDDDNTSTNPIDELPPLTHTGANTFGCLINGEVFKPQGGGLGGSSRGASYQYDWNNGEPLYHFQVFGRNTIGSNYQSISINLKFDNFDDLQQGTTYELTLFNIGGMATYDTGGQSAFETNETHTGTLYIDYYNYEERIISGTFEFEVEVNGEILHITDGRFDMHFTI